MAKPGQNRGNRNAAKKAGEMKRVQTTVSISGQSLSQLVQFLQAEQPAADISEEDIKQAIRNQVEAWIESLPALKDEPTE